MPITVGTTSITFNDSTTQSTAGITSAVTSASSGNGISVSGPTGSVVFSIAAPGFNTVGSYCSASVSGNNNIPAAGSTYSAGSGASQIQSSTLSTGGEPDIFFTNSNNLSGTWRWMGATNSRGEQLTFGNAVRVS